MCMGNGYNYLWAIPPRVLCSRVLVTSYLSLLFGGLG